jgi:hypothetical protein
MQPFSLFSIDDLRRSSFVVNDNSGVGRLSNLWRRVRTEELIRLQYTEFGVATGIYSRVRVEPR